MPLPALLYVPDGYQTEGFRLMGRRVAGQEFIRALADRLRHTPEPLAVVSPEPAQAQQLADQLARCGTAATLTWLPMIRPDRLRDIGCLHVPDPGIGRWAYARAALGPRSYSLSGIIHTLGSAGSMDLLARLALDPLHSWDALICTSRAGRDVVRRMIEAQQEYLAARCGAQRFEQPQLPLIPLGVHCRDFDFSPADRISARQSLGLSATEPVVLFVGRLSPHSKANPLPLYQALARIAPSLPSLTLLECGEYGTPEIGRAMVELQQSFPQIRFRVLGGDRPASEAEKHQALAAADLFCSLSDNIQETFGLSVVEAMAAGLPCLVSDWDGYRDTVRDGIDGFRIACRTLPAGSAADLAWAHDLGLLSYDLYIGLLSQTVVVDPEALHIRLTQLLTDSALRQRLGAAARERARQQFDWAPILARYEQLWEELDERRAGAPNLPFPPTSARPHPYRPDPTWLFAAFPSAEVPEPSHWSPGQVSLDHLDTPLLLPFRDLLFSTSDCSIWRRLLSQPFRMTLPDLTRELGSDLSRVQRQVLMLAKYGILVPAREN